MRPSKPQPRSGTRDSNPDPKLTTSPSPDLQLMAQTPLAPVSALRSGPDLIPGPNASLGASVLRPRLQIIGLTPFPTSRMRPSPTSNPRSLVQSCLWTMEPRLGKAFASLRPRTSDLILSWGLIFYPGLKPLTTQSSRWRPQSPTNRPQRPLLPILDHRCPSPRSRFYFITLSPNPVPLESALP